jgi:hypothetical protein
MEKASALDIVCKWLSLESDLVTSILHNVVQVSACAVVPARLSQRTAFLQLYHGLSPLTFELNLE